MRQEYLELSLVYARGWVYENKGKGSKAGKPIRIGTTPNVLYQRLAEVLEKGWELVGIGETASVFGKGEAAGRLYALLKTIPDDTRQSTPVSNDNQ